MSVNETDLRGNYERHDTEQLLELRKKDLTDLARKVLDEVLERRGVPLEVRDAAAGTSETHTAQQALSPFAPVRMSAKQFFFSIQGRIPRSTWWLGFSINSFVCLLALFALLNAADASPAADPIIGIFTIGIVLWAAWFNIAIGAKRWHDMDRSAWLCLMPLIPYIGALTIIWYGFVKGTTGPNRYGENPLNPAIGAQQGAPVAGPASRARG